MTDHTKVALITGAGSGIGKACSIALAQTGFAVVLTGRRSEPLNQVAAEIEEAGGTALAVPSDVSDPDSVANLFQRVRTRFGRLDFLFNNAGVNAPPRPIDELSVEEWKTVVDINLTGPFLCAREAFRIMKAQSPRGGRIINNGSISAHMPRPCSTPYTATKTAITGLTRSLSLDGRAFDIAVGQIDIGNAASAMTSRMSGGVLQANGETAPEPTMDAGNVVGAILYMASLPLDTNVQFMTVMATKMPYIGRG